VEHFEDDDDNDNDSDDVEDVSVHGSWITRRLVMLKFVVVLSSDRVTRAVNQKCAVLGNFEWLPRLDSNQE
jgi:hypothetical protein